MKNVRLLTRRVEAKKSTETAVFFEHDGIFARLDWEVGDIAEDIDPSFHYSLMADQLKNDLDDQELVDSIRAKQVAEPPIPNGAVNKFLLAGYVEQDATELEQVLVGRFGE